MNSTNYITPFWIQDLNQTSGTFTINIYRTQGYSSSYKLTIYYSTDGSTWSTFGTTGSGQTISQSFSAGTKVYLKCDSDYWSRFIGNDTIAHQITANKTHAVGGNVMSLIYGSTFAENRKYVTFPDDSVKGVFLRMFYNNTNLIDASELVIPVTHSTSTLPTQQNTNVCLASCYSRMFYGCTNLVNGPHIDLRARGEYDLWYAFYAMFYGCTSLMSVHFNTQYGNSRYGSIFDSNGGAQGCVLYNYSGTDLSSTIPSRITVQNVISMYLSGVHEYDRVVDWHSNYSGYVNQVDDSNNVTIYKKSEDKSIPFNVTNLTSSSITINVQKKSSRYSGGEYEGASSAPTVTIEYSTNGTTWSTWCTTSTSVHTMFIPAYTTYYFRASASRWAYHFYWGASNEETVAYNNITFSGTSTIELGGNILSLLYGSNFTGNETSFPDNQYTYTFAHLFGKDSHSGDVYNAITHTKNLIMPATTLTEAAYEEMFYGNTSLISTPNLPATTLAESCYKRMFQGCTSLTYASALPATTLAQECYLGMFDECTSLEIAPELKALTIPYNNTGTPIQPYIGAYQAMFYGCTSLKHVRCLATSPTDGKGTNVWLGNVSPTGTFYKKAGVTWTTGTSGIPSGWTVVEV